MLAQTRLAGSSPLVPSRPAPGGARGCGLGPDASGGAAGEGAAGKGAAGEGAGTPGAAIDGSSEELG